MQENFAEESGCADSRFAHTERIGLVHFWFEELGNEWDEHFTEDGGPFLVVRRGKISG